MRVMPLRCKLKATWLRRTLLSRAKRGERPSTGGDLAVGFGWTDPHTGVYCFASTAQLTGTPRVDGLGVTDPVFIFQIGSALTTASASSILSTDWGKVITFLAGRQLSNPGYGN